MGTRKHGNLRSAPERAFAEAFPAALYEPCEIEYLMRYKPDFLYKGFLFEIKGRILTRERSEVSSKLRASGAVLVVITTESDYYVWQLNRAKFVSTKGVLRGVAIGRWADEQNYNCIVSTLSTLKADVEAWIANPVNADKKVCDSTWLEASS